MSQIMDSILMSTKKMLGGLSPEEESPFDADIIMQINSTFSILQQLGVGPLEGFSIEDSGALWTDFSDDPIILNMVKPYMYARVRLGFDLSGTSSAVVEALNRQVAEFEYRMNTRVDSGKEKV